MVTLWINSTPLKKGNKMPETIDLTPNWEPLIPVLLEIYASESTSPEGKKAIKEELLRLAKGMDKFMKLCSDCRDCKEPKEYEPNYVSAEVMNAVDIVVDALERYY